MLVNKECDLNIICTLSEPPGLWAVAFVTKDQVVCRLMENVNPKGSLCKMC